ncbi:MAG: KH domain-containing protein [Coriobacteriia bacterium]
MTEESAASTKKDTEEFLRHIVEGLVDDPASVSLQRSERGRNVSFEISVHPDDVGKVIGKQGRVIRALRVLAKAAGVLEGKNVYVDVAD